MEALASSCSKVLIDGHGSSSASRGVVRFSDKASFCFSLGSQNDEKVGKFRILQMIQNKSISPVHALPSKTQLQEGLENAGLQAQGTEETTTNVVRIKFQLQKDCRYGEQFHIVGDDPIIGSWDPSNALPMTWSEGHIWFVEMDIPVGKSIQFKFILKGAVGDITWQPGSDRIIKTWETINRIIVCEDWEDAENQKIIEEKQLDSDCSNGKPQIYPVDMTMNEAGNNQAAEPNMQQNIDDSTSSTMKSPMAIVADNIGSSEDVTKTTVRRRGVNNMALQSETAVHDLGHMVNNQGKKVVKGNLIDYEGGPVLVPGLTPPHDVPTEQTTAAKGEVIERITMDTSNGSFEAKDQNMPESNQEEESDDGTSKLEIIETVNDEPEVVDDEYEVESHSFSAMGGKSESHTAHEYEKESHLVRAMDEISESHTAHEYEEKSHLVRAMDEISESHTTHEYEEKSHLVTAMDEISESHTSQENVLRNDIKWGHGILMKFLTKLRLV